MEEKVFRTSFFAEGFRYTCLTSPGVVRRERVPLPLPSHHLLTNSSGSRHSVPAITPISFPLFSFPRIRLPWHCSFGIEPLQRAISLRKLSQKLLTPCSINRDR